MTDPNESSSVLSTLLGIGVLLGLTLTLILATLIIWTDPAVRGGVLISLITATFAAATKIYSAGPTTPQRGRRRKVRRSR